MAARTRRGTSHTGWANSVRERIQTSMLMKRLQDHVLGKIDLSATQVRAAEGLLKKVLPDLTATELSGAVERTTVIRAPETVSNTREWLDKYGPGQPELTKPPAKPLN